MIARLQQQLEPWLHRLSRPRRFYHGGRWCEHGSRSLFAEQVIGRDHCQYICLDLNHLPSSKRADALKYQVANFSPWPNANYQVAWRQGYAQLWFWPGSIDSGSVVARHAEPVFWQPPPTDGLYLYRCAEGFDLQHWQQGRLRASQWYGSQPDRARQQWFARSQGLTLNDVLESQQPVVQPQPWSSVRVNPLQGMVQKPAGLLRWVAFLFVLIASVQLAALVQWNWQAASYERHHQELEQQLSEVLEQRARARTTSAHHQRLFPLLDGIDPLQVHFLVTDRLASAADFEIVNWSRQGLQAEVTIQTSNDSTLDMVNALRGEGVRDVQAQPGPRAGQYRLEIELLPPLPWPEGLSREG